MRVGVVLGWHNLDWDRYETGDFSRPPEPSDSEVFLNNRYIADLVEPLGYDSLFAVEHHGSPHHLTGNTLDIMKYFAGRTSRIDFGTCLIVLPWHHPLRVAEEICFLDNLIDGRKLWLGFGRGSAPWEYHYFNIDQNQSRDRFREALDIVRLALTEERFSYDGEIWQMKDVAVRPRPRTPDLIDRFYCGVTSEATLSIAAHAGLKMMFVPVRPWDEYPSQVAAFNAIRAEHGWKPSNPIVVAPTYCAPTAEMAWDGAVKYLGSYARTSVKHYSRGAEGLAAHPAPGGAVFAPASTPTTGGNGSNADDDGLAWIGNGVFGTPDECIEKIQWLADNVHADHLVCVQNIGGIPRDEAERSVTLFAKEVLPVVKQMMPAPFPAASIGT